VESSVGIDASPASTFRLINVAGRATLDLDGHVYDLARVSGDDRLADPMAAIAAHAHLGELTDRCAELDPDASLEGLELGPPVPRPRQIFGIGLNYRDHAAESGMELPPAPLTFTKFPTCLAGPTAEIPLSGPMVDWEAEIVVVIGARTRSIAVEHAWSAVAGLTLGQDISDRAVQLTGSPPQFSLGKSFTAYGPIGPAVVPPSAFADPDNIGLWCEVSGERVQDAHTDQLIFPIPVLVAYLSSICELSPGDLIFTGTPAGVGMGRGRFLAPGDVVTTGAEVIGELRNTCVAGAGPLTV
jgi:2-keto-4-pentenoate hydratase/2-oxohepta-3-ene-1,7-dioic acid hydratase in catechol pathway